MLALDQCKINRGILKEHKIMLGPFKSMFGALGYLTFLKSSNSFQSSLMLKFTKWILVFFRADKYPWLKLNLFHAIRSQSV